MNFNNTNILNNDLISKDIFKNIIHKFFILKKSNSNLLFEDFLRYLFKCKWLNSKLDVNNILIELNSITFNEVYDYILSQAITNPFINLNNIEDLI